MKPDDEPCEVTYETIEEAIAEAWSQVGPSGVVVIHAEDCALETSDDEDDCTCEPIELKRGALA